MKDTLVGFIKTQLEMLEEDELITEVETQTTFISPHSPIPQSGLRRMKLFLVGISEAQLIYCEVRLKICQSGVSNHLFLPTIHRASLIPQHGLQRIWLENERYSGRIYRNPT